MIQKDALEVALRPLASLKQNTFSYRCLTCESEVGFRLSAIYVVTVSEPLVELNTQAHVPEKHQKSTVCHSATSNKPDKAHIDEVVLGGSLWGCRTSVIQCADGLSRQHGLLEDQLHQQRNPVVGAVRLRHQVYDLIRPCQTADTLQPSSTTTSHMHIAKVLGSAQRVEFLNLRHMTASLLCEQKGPLYPEASAVSLFRTLLMFFTKESSELSLLSACTSCEWSKPENRHPPAICRRN